MSTALSQEKIGLRFWEWGKSELPFHLSPEREKKLFKELEKNPGNEEVRKEIIEKNARLVYSLVYEIKNEPSITGLQLEDLCQVGIIGVIKAVDTFHWRRGYKFSTYAFPLIIQEITRAIYDKARMIRIPTYRLLAIAEYKEVEANLLQKLKRLVSTQEIAEKMETDEIEINLLKQIKYNLVSLESSLKRNDGDGKEFLLIDTIRNKTIVSPLSNALREDLRGELIKALSCLNIREKRILIMRFLAENGEGYTLKKTGKILGGLTKERVRQIQNIALEKLRQRKPQLRELLE